MKPTTKRNEGASSEPKNYDDQVRQATSNTKTNAELLQPDPKLPMLQPTLNGIMIHNRTQGRPALPQPTTYGAKPEHLASHPHRRVR